MDIQQCMGERTGPFRSNGDVDEAPCGIAFGDDVRALIDDGLHHVSGQVRGVGERQGGLQDGLTYAGIGDGFAACFHEAVRVYEGDDCTIEGRDALRERYRTLFEGGGFGADVPTRLVQGPHCVDHETWWRVDPDSGERRGGALLVRYTLRDQLIGTVQFLYDD